jgi:hypothetical protein
MGSAFSIDNRYAFSILVFLICFVFFMGIDYLLQTSLGNIPGLTGSLGAAVVSFLLKKQDKSK